MVPWFLEFVPSYLEMVPGYPAVVPGNLGLINGYQVEGPEYLARVLCYLVVPGYLEKDWSLVSQVASFGTKVLSLVT